MLLALAGCATPAPNPFPQLDRIQEVEAPPGNVVVQVQPADAQVVVDGVPQGLGSDFDGVHGALTLAAGPHRLILRRDGFRPYESMVFATESGRQSVQVVLDKN